MSTSITLRALVVLAGLLTLSPNAASAHEEQMFEIGGRQYQFVVGSLNEPVAVDDKTGVDIRISSGGAVTGLEENLQVELIAGDKKKILDLSPVYNTPGAYKAPFYPTVATTLSYRVFGELNGTPVDLTFTCNPAGHGDAEEDTKRVELSPGVARLMKTGAFGCPAEKAALGFPEASASVKDMQETTNDAKGLGMTGVGLGILALLIAGYGAMRKS